MQFWNWIEHFGYQNRIALDLGGFSKEFPTIAINVSGYQECN